MDGETCVAMLYHGALEIEELICMIKETDDENEKCCMEEKLEFLQDMFCYI